MYRGLFLDRDGVINYDYGYVGNVERFKFNDDIFSLVKRANNLNFKVIVVTNQAGIARGLYSEIDFLNLNEWMINSFKERGCKITETFYCPFHPTKGIDFYRKNSFDRKPLPGMILKASDKHFIDLKKSILVGDKVSDIDAGKAANIPKLYYLDSGEIITGAISIENLKEINFD